MWSKSSSRLDSAQGICCSAGRRLSADLPVGEVSPEGKTRSFHAGSDASASKQSAGALKPNCKVGVPAHQAELWRISRTQGEEFKALVKEKGVGDPGQHDNSVFRAALHWFFDLGAIERDELDDVERLYTLRTDVLITFGVYVKIVRWWVKEVEATTNPDVTPELYENTAWDEVESTGTIFLREILHKALAGNAEWAELQKGVHAASAPQTS